MSELHAPMTVRRIEPDQLTIESLAACARVHPALIAYFVEYGLLEPSARMGTQWLFDTRCIVRLRMIERLRRDLGANLPGIAVILDLLDRLSALQHEVEQCRRRA